MVNVYGIDFGTTNSLVSIIEDNKALSLLQNEAPHPSIVICRGDEMTTGQIAKEQADADDVVDDGVVRSPKIFLGRDNNFYPIPGRKDISREDLVSCVLTNLVSDAKRRENSNFDIQQAVFTIPVTFDGKSREELRSAAKKSGIDVVYFVHEPLAALYGFFKEQVSKELSIQAFESKFVLVFDWGGGTLDITVCQVRDGILCQIKNTGDSSIGGDEFDKNIQSYIETQHCIKHNIQGLQVLRKEGVTTKLKMQCEYAKKQLSEIDVTEIFIQSYLNTEGKSSTLDVVLTRKEIEDSCKNRIDAGINLIDQILKDVDLDYKDIELCLPTGGMVNMPAIRRKLDQLFPGKVSEPKHGDRIISQGAAWIAHDKAIPVLAKPLEIIDASGAPFVVAQADHPLPTDGRSEIIAHSQFYSTDPRQGQVVFTFQRPVYLERYSQHTPRKIYDHLYLKIDPNAGPLVERLNLKIEIDENYIVKIEGFSTGRRDESKIEIVNLEFALRAYNKNDEENEEDENQYSENSNYDNDNNLELHRTNKVNEAYKLNPKIRAVITNKSSYEGRKFVAGDIFQDYYKLNDVNSSRMSERQKIEKSYYDLCSICNRNSYQISLEGCDCNK